MANEITKSVALAVTKGGAAIASGTLQKTQDLTGEDVLTGTQLIGFAAPEVLDTGDVESLPGSLAIKNLDSTNFISITMTTCKLRPGDVMLVQPTTQVTLQADTAAVRVQKWLCDV